MEIPAPQGRPIVCPRCGGRAEFFLPYHLLRLTEEEVTAFEARMRQHPHRVTLERLSGWHVLWHFPDLYHGPWDGWDARFGVCLCRGCGLRRKYDWRARRHQA